MKKTVYILPVLFIVFALNTVFAQSDASGKNSGNVSLSAYVSNQIENFPPGAMDLMRNKLNQIITQNGVTNSGLGSRFIITPNINVISKDLTATAPPMTAMNLDITFYIGDGYDGKKFASKTISVKAVGTNETKAYIEGIKNIKPTDPNLVSFIAEGKKKIIDYYNTNCDVAIKNAQSAASLGNYEDAIAQLTGVPEACKACYDKSMSAAEPLYKKYMDRECSIKLTEARAAWNANQNSNGASDAGQIMATIDPSASCYKEAKALNNEISKRMEELGNKEWEYKFKEQEGVVEVAKARVKAYQAISEAYYNSQRPVVNVYRINWW